MARTDVSSLRAGVVINCSFPTKSCFLLNGLCETGGRHLFTRLACGSPAEGGAADAGGATCTLPVLPQALVLGMVPGSLSSLTHL